MANYDFGILQPIEFEDLSRDVLQTREKVTVESFTDGRDGGIDCRFAYMNKTAIVQCKRYKDWDTLKSTLKKEIEKVKKLNPDRYILTTSVGLTPANKAYIKSLFTPYIKIETDILGRDDLNNELFYHPEIEQRHYKLWMSSTHVLQHILYKEIEAWGGMELSEIQEELSKYVENPSFPQAIEMLTEHHFLIISGIPGIGKTTLARMLVLYFMEKRGCEDFVWISDGLEDALKKRNPEKKMIIFYDDFMGKNYFEMTGTGFDKKLSAFIKEIQRAGNIWLIMATREYILQEARLSYDRTYMHPLDESKYILDLNTYSPLIRGHMLYNHLSVANLPVEYGRVLYKDKNYLKLVKHSNFNPRLIETIVTQRDWEHVPAPKFMNHLLNFFDKPESVWIQAYEQLKPIEQYALLFLVTTPHTIFVDDWYDGVCFFCQETQAELHLVIDPMLWDKLLQKLEQSFIRTSRSDNNKYTVSFVNPSVLDFLIAYIREHEKLVALLLKGIYYTEQLYSTFTEQPVTQRNSTQIQIKPELWNDFIRISQDAHNRKLVCGICSTYGNRVFRDSFVELEFGDRYLKKFPTINKYGGYIIEHSLVLDDFATSYVDYAISIMKKLEWTEVSFTLKDAIEYCMCNIESLDDISSLMDVCFDSGEEAILMADDFKKQIETAVEGDLQICGTESECDDKIDLLNRISERLPLLFLAQYEEAFLKKKEEIVCNVDYDDDDGYERPIVKADVEDIRLNEMFSELCEVR